MMVKLFHKINDERENGQAILLIALTLVILLGFTGLAIDGGNLFFTQRDAQNSVDAALLAAIYAQCAHYDSYSSPSDPALFATVQAAALNAASLNGFDNNGVDNTVTVNQLDAQWFTDRGMTVPTFPEYFFEIEIWADAPTYLIQVVYDGVTEVTVHGVGQCRPTFKPFPSQAVVSLGGGVCGGNADVGIDLGGNGQLTTIGGGMFTNSTCSSSPGCAAQLGSNTDASIDENHGITVVGGCVYDPSGQLLPGQTNTNVDPQPDPFAHVDPPSDACIGTKQIAKGSGTYSPGYYDEITLLNGSMTLEPGIYCVDGKGVNINGGDFYAPGVIFYIKSGGFSVGGNGTMNLLAPSADPASPAYCGGETDPYGTCQWVGMMLWDASPNSPSDDISLTGGGASLFKGTLYAPHLKCTVAGNGSNLTLSAQFICNTFETTGTGDITIVYDPPDLFTIPPTLSVNE